VTLDAQAAVIIALVGVVIGVIGVVLAAVGWFRLLRLQRSYDLLSVAEGRETYVDVLSRTREEFLELSSDMYELTKQVKSTRADLARALRHVSVVRYDAYGDMAGRYSFSAALLDDSGDGLIITSIHGRNETRSYLKGIARGSADIPLSPEEEMAVSQAKGVGT
jgi:hypothetical protein